MNTLAAAMPMLRFFLLLFLGATTAVNGVLMLLFTQGWYGCVVAPAGLAAYNAHFVSDVGAAYLATGSGLLWAGFRPAYTFPLVMIALAFAALHAGLHVRDYALTGMPTRHWIIEVFGIWAPVALLGWLAAGTRPRR